MRYLIVSYIRRGTFLALFLISLTKIQGQSGRLKLSALFSDHMVLQQNSWVRIWGESMPDDIISLEIGDLMVTCQSGSDGLWNAMLPPMPAGGPYQLVIGGQNEQILIDDVLVGEVWFASGQSNMEWRMKSGVLNQEEEIRSSYFPQIRMFTVPKSTSVVPIDTMIEGVWEISSPLTTPDFSAISYFFARELSAQKNVPVGIINASWGATDIESWMSRDILLTNKEVHDKILKVSTDTFEWRLLVEKSLQAELNREIIAMNSTLGVDLGVHQLEFDDHDWRFAEYPFSVSDIGYGDYWGLIWLRKTFDWSAAETFGANLILPIQGKNIRVFLNGQMLANKSDKINSIKIPEGLLKSGQNTIAVRLYVNWGTGKVGSIEENLCIETHLGEKKMLDNIWKYDTDIEPKVAQWQNYYVTPTVLFNGMVAPIIPYTIRGFLWYQGENNVSSGRLYADLQTLLIQDWRIRWQNDYLPFVFVQLPNYGDRVEHPIDSHSWADFRGWQATVPKRSPFTSMVSTIDIGEADNIHPHNKQDVGKRMALAACYWAYGDSVVWSGPVAHEVFLRQDTVIVSFHHVGSGLKVKNGLELKGFALAGEDGVWSWANAQINGEVVEVWSDKISQPLRIQYGWQNNPDCNLMNEEGLPAVPFKKSF